MPELAPAHPPLPPEAVSALAPWAESQPPASFGPPSPAAGTPLADPLNRELVAAHGGVLPGLDAASAEVRSCRTGSL